jgi:ribosome-binding factor A
VPVLCAVWQPVFTNVCALRSPINNVGVLFALLVRAVKVSHERQVEHADIFVTSIGEQESIERVVATHSTACCPFCQAAKAEGLDLTVSIV